MLGAPGDDEDVAGVQLNGAFLAAGLAKGDVETPVEHQEELVGVLVDVPDVVAAGVRDLDVIVIDPADDPRAVDLGERGQRLAQADRSRSHTPIVDDG